MENVKGKLRYCSIKDGVMSEWAIGDGLDSRDVADAGAHICRQLAAGNAAAQSVLDQHLFAALGVLGVSHQNFQTLFVLALGLHQLDSVGLVFLDTDLKCSISKILAHILAHILDTVVDEICVREHHSVVRGDVGLAFSRVDKYGIYLDDGTAGQEVYGNIFYEVKGQNIVFNGGRDNITVVIMKG